MEDILSFAFAGLFSMTLLSLNFNFLLGMKLRQMGNKLETMEEQMAKGKEADRMIVEEINEIVLVMDEKIRPILEQVASKK